MSDQEFENYLILLGGLLRLSARQRRSIGAELRDHMENRVADLLEAGCPREEATRRALEEFGDAAALAASFSTIAQRTRRRWMMRFATLSVMGLFLTVVLVVAMWPNDARFGGPAGSLAQDAGLSSQAASAFPSPGENNDATLQKLEEPVSVDFVEMRFADALATVVEKLGVNSWVDQSTEDNGLSMDEPITFSMQHVRCSTCLELILRPYDCTYTVKDGIVIILGNDAAEDDPYLMVRVFDCRTLVDSLNTDLAELIMQMVQPDSWEVNGGVGRVQQVDGMLVARHKPTLLRQIDQLLAELQHKTTGRQELGVGQFLRN